MRYVCMLIVMTALVFVAVGSARGITSPGPLMLARTGVDASKDPPPPPPPPRSKRCPPDPKDDKCGKGNDSKLP